VLLASRVPNRNSAAATQLIWAVIHAVGPSKSRLTDTTVTDTTVRKARGMRSIAGAMR
jgi:hypothetical protein